MKIFLTIIISFLCLYVQAQQVVLERQVIGAVQTDALYHGTRISGTAGEAVTATGNNPEKDFTQGFHQPKSPNPLRVFARGIATTCISMEDGELIIDSITGCEEPFSILWDSGDTLSHIKNVKAGTYFLTVYTEFCSQNVEVIVEEGPGACPLTFYTAITPNKDGANDIWFIENIDLLYYADNEVSIYNRAGQQVWKVRGYNNAENSWSGENANNRELPSGTYFYMMSVKDEMYKGYLELVR